MNISILGATGRVGRQIAALALQDGHQVTALVRDPDKIAIMEKQLTLVKGNALNKENIARVLHGQNVVFSALSTDGSTTLSASMPLIIEAMYKEGIKRIITIGTAGILQSRAQPHLLRYESAESKRKLTRAAEEHHKAYELLRQSRLDWTIVCPTYLPEGKHVGAYRVERDFLPEGGSEISVSDTAEFAYRQIGDKTYIRARAGIAY
ncbi:NAD(P)-dependent oxidoreductase [Paenibacillus woosongensis]|uniref:NAD(P)H-binding protein n=1 Tax=Paenibacillus woosongensis TaxID=307580 RepID=A0A7X3CL45_9BACL|nr:SDR family oxidoreductase [Paenibacillus woosongensis]MUG43963.1 NAD(P)H-binding protein [Paenibacillus woosongensis]